jgi:ABC-2 type transport system ATP-binding protein
MTVPTTDYAVQVQDLVKVFHTRFRRREVRAVDGISFGVERGTTFGLLGPNGAGKTTTVKMLLASVHPTSGSATIFGKDARRKDARLPVGYLPENHRFPTYFTGAGMLDLYGALSGIDVATRKRRIPELFDLVGLEQKWAGVRLGKYSKGMLQRVGLAQALLHEPKLLILDEPTDGVDPVGRVHIRGILQRLEEKGTTIFINSHMLAEVELFCRDVVIIHKGKVALAGRVRDLTASKGFRVKARDIPDAMHYPSIEEANAALDSLRAQNLTIESFTQSSSTLEEVFVQAVRNV